MAAVVLPFAATWATGRWEALRTIPFALHFAGIAAVAAVGGMWPALLAIALSVGSFDVHTTPPVHRLGDRQQEFVRFGVLLGTALLISLLSKQRRAAELALAESEASYKATLESIGDAVISTDAAGRIEFMNGVAEGLSGWGKEEARGLALEEVFRTESEATGERVESPLSEVRRTGVSSGVAERTVLTQRNGGQVPIDESGAPILDRKGRTVGMVLVFRNVADKRAAEERLRIAVARLQERTDALVQAQQYGKSAAWVYDLVEQKTTWYEGGAEIFGRPFSDFADMKTPTHLIEASDQENIARATALTIATGAPFNVEFRVRWPNGDLHTLEARGTPVPNDRRLWRGVTFDVTERKNAEIALVRSEKLAAVGRIASTISHEVNNPLEAVTNLLYLVRGDASLSEEAREYLGQADAELARLGNITRLTLSFVRQVKVTGPVDAAEMVENAAALFKGRLQWKGIEVEREYEAGVRVDVLGDELRQVMINLISNAVDALSGDKCRLRLEVKRRQGRVEIRVEDNGSGIAMKDRERVFEPFFTTKEEIGTGIGLWVTKELVEKNGGSIAHEDLAGAMGMRTRFRVEFPEAV